MAKVRLSKRQIEVRRILIRERGNIRPGAIALELGCHRTTAWRAMVAISRINPLPDYEAQARNRIREAIEYYDLQLEVLLDELHDTEDRRDMLPANDPAVGLLQIRVALLNQIRQLRRDQIEFMQSVGLMDKVPDKLAIVDLAKPDQITAEIRRLEAKMNHASATD